jgi:Holliday junction resolvase
MEQEWYWEGNVQSRIVGYLQTQGWRIIREADTERHEKGVDILAFRDGKMLAIEVKG